MQTNQLAEIGNHLRHNDTSLAVRRMLDFALESENKDLLIKSIAWSRKYNSHEGAEPGEAFYADGFSLLEQAQKMSTIPMKQPIKLLDAKSISKSYSVGGFTLKPMDISLESGEIIGVVGENGNGKTTLLRTLAGQLYNDSGTISYSMLENPDYYSVKSYVVFMPQRIPRWYGYLKDNLHFAASIAGLYGAENELMVNFMVERLGLTKFIDLTWDRISSGYRTRFELARILLQKPQLLILDEPLANLDIKAQQTILTDLRFIAKSAYNPMGVILSSQQLHEVEKIADDVVFIKNGECIYQSNKADSPGVKGFAIEIETTVAKETIMEILKGAAADIQFNGGFYTITSGEAYPPGELVKRLLDNGIAITYFRDITFSTKRYF